MRLPQVFTASEIASWPVSERVGVGKWLPARPCAFHVFGLKCEWIKYRLRITWKVFTGKYDALNWQGTGGRSNEETLYRDILHPEFKGTS